MGKRKKNNQSKNAPKNRSKTANSNGEDSEEEEEKENVTTVKVPLKNILRPKYRKIIIAAIREKALISTKITHLASLLFLRKVQSAFDSDNVAFFQVNNVGGQGAIKQCFEAVLQQNVNSYKMDADFREFVNNLDEENRFDWPNNDNFGNANKDIIQQYETNVKTNLYTHRKKRLREYLRMRVYQNNQLNQPPVYFEQKDIDHAIAWAIYGRESIRESTMNYLQRRHRRDLLLQMINDISWFHFDHTNVSRYTKNYWFASIQMWISMQRQIDQFNTDHQQRDDRIQHRRQLKRKRRKNRQQQQQPPENVNKPPKVRNLCVIPICSIKRMHYPMDNYTFMKLLIETDLIPKYPSKRMNKNGKRERNVTQDEFFEHYQYYWNQYFYLRKIKYFVRYKKNFRFRILSDGIAASLQYDVDEIGSNDLDKRGIARQCKNGEIEGEAAIDPGDKTWMAYVYRDIATSKEVIETIELLFFSFHFNQPLFI